MDLGAVTVADDQKVNLGACLLRSALCQWAHAFSKLYLSGAPIPGLDDPGAEQLPRFRSDLTPAGEGWQIGLLNSGGGVQAATAGVVLQYPEFRLSTKNSAGGLHLHSLTQHCYAFMIRACCDHPQNKDLSNHSAISSSCLHPPLSSHFCHVICPAGACVQWFPPMLLVCHGV